MSDEKKTRQMTFTVLEDGTVRADFGENVDPVSFQPASLPESLFPQALAKGFITRLQGYTSRLAGDDRTPEKLRAAIEKGLADLRAGTWAAERTPGESPAGEVSIAAEAAFLYRVSRAAEKGEEYTKTLEETAEEYNALTDDQKKQLAEVPRYKAAYAKVKAARQTKKAEKLAKKAGAEADFF